MTFYLRPPSGTTHFQSLEKSAITRLNFLLQLDATSGDPVKVHDLLTDISLVEESDCLIEGTRKDRISHYILRLAFAGKPEVTQFLLRAEILFFEVRFLNMESKGITKLLHSLDALLIESELKLNERRLMQDDDFGLSEILGSFLKLCRQFGTWQSVVEKYFSGSQSEFMEVSFAYVLDLVKNRSVTLTHGMASLPLAKFRLVVMALYETLLKAGLLQAKKRYDIVKYDIRMKRLFGKLHSIYRDQKSSSTNGRHVRRQLNHTEVDTELFFFPPCMSHLHRQLREKHRLKHHSRIQYTLFLKEIGMPVHEAIMFWKQEYSLVSGDKKTCCHAWLRDEQRYTYNIRHLYGLEGSRVNYRGHSCQSLQNNEFGHQEEGGCPFVRFDKIHMTDFLQSENVVSTSQDKILKSVAKGDYQGACQTFLCCKSQEESQTTERLGHVDRTLTDQNKSSNELLEKKLSEEVSMEVDVKQRFSYKNLNVFDFQQTMDGTKLVNCDLKHELSNKIPCDFENNCQKEMDLAPCIEGCKNVEKIKFSPPHRHSVVDSEVKPTSLTNLNGLDESFTEKYKIAQKMKSQAFTNLYDFQISKPLDFYDSLKLLQDQ